MVERLNAGTSAGAIAPVAAAPRVAAPKGVLTTTPTETQAATIPSLARTLAAEPPVDVDRVKRIKEAIAAGKFPLSPSTVADALIAAKYEWMSNDQA